MDGVDTAIVAMDITADTAIAVGTDTGADMEIMAATAADITALPIEAGFPPDMAAVDTTAVIAAAAT
jgi:hypothetical protein